MLNLILRPGVGTKAQEAPDAFWPSVIRCLEDATERDSLPLTPSPFGMELLVPWHVA